MKQASDCNTVLVHDIDLVMIKGIGHGTVSGLLNISYIIVLLMSTATGKPRTRRDDGPPTDV